MTKPFFYNKIFVFKRVICVKKVYNCISNPNSPAQDTDAREALPVHNVTDSRKTNFNNLKIEK